MKAKIHVVDERTFKERANDWKNRQKDNLSRAWYWTVDNKGDMSSCAVNFPIQKHCLLRKGVIVEKD